MRINTNISAVIANNALQNAQTRLSKSIERLSSGYKINSSADDAAGCAISEKMRMQLRGLERSKNNSTDGVSVLNTAEGGIAEIQSMLSRMKELTVQATSDTNSDTDRAAIQEEIDSINDEINRISGDTEFNTQTLLDGGLNRRVYSDCPGVNQLECSDNIVSGNYGITITQDARQAVIVGDSNISMSASDRITADQAGSIMVNGYKININEGDDLNAVMEKIIAGVDKTGGSAFAISENATNDTLANGTKCAGYAPSTQYSGNRLVIMTDTYGSNQTISLTCSNQNLANILGITDAGTEEGIQAHGSDVKADFTTGTDGKRTGFDDSAILSTEGTVVTVRDVNNKVFKFDVPGNTTGTVFSDTAKNDGESTVTNAKSREIVQEVTDIGVMSIHVGANENQTIKINIPAVTAYSIGTQNVNVMTNVTASQAIATIDKAIDTVNGIRSKIGAYQNRFDSTNSNLGSVIENVNSSISAMIDTDMAEEMTEYTSLNVLTQAATSILSQANERPSTVLQLLQ